MRLVEIVLMDDWKLPHGPKALKGSRWKALRILNNRFEPYPFNPDKGEVFGYLVFFKSTVLFMSVEDVDEF